MVHGNMHRGDSLRVCEVENVLWAHWGILAPSCREGNGKVGTCVCASRPRLWVNKGKVWQEFEAIHYGFRNLFLFIEIGRRSSDSNPEALFPPHQEKKPEFLDFPRPEITFGCYFVAGNAFTTSKSRSRTLCALCPSLWILNGKTVIP